jgi:BNR repeat-like domain
MTTRHVFVATCAAAAALALPPTGHAANTGPHQASGASPFAPNCNGAPQGGVTYRGSEVEPWIDVNPTSPLNLIGVYQQDRISTGGANGQGTSVSRDGGTSWTRLGVGALPKFSRCNGAAAGSSGDYERATDPWVSFGPDGDAYQISLGFNDTRNLANAVLVSESKDGGSTWGPVKVLQADTDPNVFNDKESLTADWTNANFVYAIWDRLVFPNERSSGNSFNTAAAFDGPTLFTRSTNGGATWETPRVIYQPARNDQSIGSQIVVMPDGDLVNVFGAFFNDNKSGRKGEWVSIQRSTDKGATWSGKLDVSRLGTIGVTDPRDGHLVRTGDIIPEIASDERAGTDNVYVVWQDARFTGFARDQIAFSKSTDGGRTWTAPVRISRVLGTQAFTPAIRVDSSGAIVVTYYDFRNDTTSSPSLDTDLWATRSTDGGRTWTEERLTRAPFDMRNAPDARGFFVGDYSGLATRGTTAVPLASMSPGATDAFSWILTPPLGGPTYRPDAREGAGVPDKAFPVAHGRPAPA